MGDRMQEWEWKKLRKLKEMALDRLCGRALAEVEDLLARPGPGDHERFLQLFRHIADRNADIAEAFDDLRRATADHRLAAMRALELIGDDELAEFSDQTRDGVEFLARELYKHLSDEKT
jgi:hypothetical protein